MKRFKISLACLLAVILLLSLDTTVRADGSSAEASFPTNERGETYGDYFQALEAGTDPDLILAQGEDGTLGYVRASDLEEPMPESPEAALALQAERQASGYKGRYINLYASDGITVIGRYFVDAGSLDNYSITARSSITYSAYSSMASVNHNLQGRSFIQRAWNGVTFGGEISSSDVMQAGELAVKIQLYDFDSGALISSPGYSYSNTPGMEFQYSTLHKTSSGVYYCKGMARGYDREEQVWGNFALKKTGNCQIP